MLACKRLARLTVCLLLLGMLVAMVPGQPIVESAEAAQTGGRIVTLVRRSAYFSSTVIGCFENGTHLKVLGETQQFYRVDCYDMVGYIAKTQVQKDADGK